MKLAQLLLKALTGIGDDLVEEAARPALPRPRWLRLLPWAALFALLVGGALALRRLTPPAAPDAAPSGQEASLQTLPPDEAEETAPAEPDAPEPDAAALPAALARFHAPRGAYTLERSGFLVGSQVAVDYDGRVIAETDSGVVSLVWDYATGGWRRWRSRNGPPARQCPRRTTAFPSTPWRGKTCWTSRPSASA